MTMISKTAVGIAFGIAGIFVGYCFYFDQKRRGDPEFKKKLRERRKLRKQAVKDNTKFPDMRDHQAVQHFFVQQIQLGEELLASDDYDTSTDHFANAIMFCGQPRELLRILEQTLSPDIYNMTIQKLQKLQKMQKLQNLQAVQQLLTQTHMTEEDVE